MPPRPGLPGPGLPGPGPTQEHINNINMMPTQTSTILYDNFLEPMGHSKFSELRTRMVLLPPDIKGNQEGYILSVHRSDNKDENRYLFEVTSKFIENRPPQRNGKSLDGVGKMVGIGEHLTPTDGHCNFVDYTMQDPLGKFQGEIDSV